MIGTLILSIGAINALIPILIILILIAAAAGSTRGSKLFELFGISTLLGVNVGRGTISRKSPFKTKRFTRSGAGGSKSRNPFERAVGGTHDLAKEAIKSKVINPYTAAKFGNNAFGNVENNVKSGLAGAKAIGVTPHDWHTNNVNGVMGDIKKYNIKVGSFATALESNIRGSINKNIGKTNSNYAKKLSGLHNNLNTGKITQQEFDTRREEMRREYVQKINEAHAKTSEEIAKNIKANNVPAYVVPKGMTPSQTAALREYRSLYAQKRDILVDITKKANALNGIKAAEAEKDKLELQLKAGSITRDQFEKQVDSLKPMLQLRPKEVNKGLTEANDKLKETQDIIRKIEQDNKNDSFLTGKSGEFKNISKTLNESVQRSIANEEIGNKVLKKMDVKVYNKKHGV